VVSRKTKILIGAAAAGIAAAIVVAKKLHEKGYDKKAVSLLKTYADKIKKEAANLEKRARASAKKETAKAKPAKKKSAKKTAKKKPVKKK